MLRSEITEELRQRFKPAVYMTIGQIADYRGCCKNTARKLMAGVDKSKSHLHGRGRMYHIKDVAACIAECTCV